MARLKFDGFSWLDILDVDSYKISHWKQYPPNTTWMMSYLEARGGTDDHTVFFGLQYIIKRYLQPLLVSDLWTNNLERVEEFTALHGLPFNRAGWERIVELGYFPVKIRAVPEGSLIPHGNVLMTVESTDPETFWIVSWLETMLQRLWYPINVATLAYDIRNIIQWHLDDTSDNTDATFKLHDFGSRGSSSQESAAIASMAHLLSFKGTDTVAGLLYASEFYHAEMAGFSIPASEHSTMTMWTRQREAEAYGNMLDNYGGPGRVVAIVSDSYDLFSAIRDIYGGELKEKIKSCGGTLVIRPDSGDPSTTALRTMFALDRAFEEDMSTNSKGYRTLPPYLRIIWGDGINAASIEQTLFRFKRAKYACDNISFGMGGALVQKHDRDTHRMAFKCCAAEVDGKLVEVFKEPVTDPNKNSKRGVLDLVYDEDTGYRTRSYSKRHDFDMLEGIKSEMRTVFENGKLLIDETLDQIRERLWE